MKDNEGYDGNRLHRNEMYTLDLEYERQMWKYWKKLYPDGFPWSSVLKNTDGIVGKAMITSTVDLDDSGSNFKELGTDSQPEKESALYKIFRSVWDDHESQPKEVPVTMLTPPFDLWDTISTEQWQAMSDEERDKIIKERR